MRSQYLGESPSSPCPNAWSLEIFTRNLYREPGQSICSSLTWGWLNVQQLKYIEISWNTRRYVLCPTSPSTTIRCSVSLMLCARANILLYTHVLEVVVITVAPPGQNAPACALSLILSFGVRESCRSFVSPRDCFSSKYSTIKNHRKTSHSSHRLHARIVLGHPSSTR